MKTACTQLSVIKIWQILQSKEFIKNFAYLKSTIGGYIFTNTNQMLENKEMFELSFGSKKCPQLLIVESSCDFNEILKMSSNFPKTVKVILIFDSKYKSNVESQYVKEDVFSYADLTLNSQNKLLEKEVKLQGKSIQLKQLICKDVAKQVLVSPIYLTQFLTNIPITLGNVDPFSSYGYCEEYYIERHLREQWIKENILTKNIKNALFFITAEPPNLRIKSCLREIEEYIHYSNAIENDNYRNGIILMSENEENPKKVFSKLCKKHRTIYWLEFRSIKPPDSQPSNSERKKKEIASVLESIQGSRRITNARIY